MDIVKLDIALVINVFDQNRFGQEIDNILAESWDGKVFLKGGCMRSVMWKVFQGKDLKIKDIDLECEERIYWPLKGNIEGDIFLLQDGISLREQIKENMDVDCSLNQGVILIWKGRVWFGGYLGVGIVTGKQIGRAHV